VVTVLLDRPRGELMVWSEPWREQLLDAGPQAPERLVEAQEGSATPR
jgi:hypothetical protein